MTKKMKHQDFHRLLLEIEALDGLPEKISTEAQLFDEIFKKEAYVMSEQLFPLIKEIYGREYPTGTAIKPLSTEFSVEQSDTKEIHSIRADITLLVAEKDIYHFECEIQNDGSMVLRMLEYDLHLSLSYFQTGKEEIMLSFPYSAVLYLQDNKNTPQHLNCKIHFQDGSSYDYHVPVLKVQSYSLEDIRQKHLNILIPFLPLRFRKNTGSSKITDKLNKEELTSFYRHIILILKEEVSNGFLSQTNHDIILSLLQKSMIRVFHKNKEFLKEVIEMTEPILETEFEKYIRVIEARDDALLQLIESVQQKDKEITEQMEINIKKDAELAQQMAINSKKDAELAQQIAINSKKDALLHQKEIQIAELQKQLEKEKSKSK